MLPHRLAAVCRAEGRPYFVLRLRGFAEGDWTDHPSHEVGLGELGRALALLKEQACEAVCLIGRVSRPDFKTLKPDWRGLTVLPRAVAAASRGDDALLRFLIGEFEREGFSVEGADVVGADVLGEGPLGALRSGPQHVLDIDHAVTAAKALGALDIGQAVAVARGVVLAVEAQEGTDALLRRVRDLPAELLGCEGARVGVLVKWPKAAQDVRVDLPTLGAATVIAAADAGLAGIIAAAGAALVVDRSAVAEAADRLGLFVEGLKRR